VRIEEPEVFEDVHALVLRLAREAPIAGVRVDHVDGLLDPLKYLRRLRRGLMGTAADAGREPYLVVEKILGAREELPRSWPVAGTTGYEFIDSLARLLVDAAGLESLGRTWRRFTGQRESFADLAYREKKRITDIHFAAETSLLERRLTRLAERDRHARDLSARDLRRALVETSACFPHYRSYVRRMDVSTQDRERRTRSPRGCAS
jgi:(1->4)-alpha-D-glucan 1-alpha-D-glucosylmutase